MATTTYAQPGTLYARSTTGSIAVPPQHGRIIRFGRNLPQKDPQVHLAFGPEDGRISRRHGELTYVQRQWWLRNTGRRPMRLPRGEMVYADAEPIPLGAGQTWVYVKGTSHREHVVELFVTDDDKHRTPPQPPGNKTLTEEWDLDTTDTLVLVVLGESYLHFDPEPRPRTYREAATLLQEVDPLGEWNHRKVEHRIEKIRLRVHKKRTFPYKVMTQKGEPKPSDNILLHNLLRGLVEEAALTPHHLNLLD